jgi:hypothetical protein
MKRKEEGSSLRDALARVDSGQPPFSQLLLFILLLNSSIQVQT